MWKHCVKKCIPVSKTISNNTLHSTVLQKNTSRAIFCVAQQQQQQQRFATTNHKRNDNTYSNNTRHYVNVETPFAKANKYTYLMPEDPYQASKRITRILEIGTVEDASDYLLALPVHLQSNVLWNQLIGHCAHYGRANYAEKFYSQMRKRGMKPNESTFTLMIQAYSKSDSPQASKHAEKWIEKMSDFDLEPSIIHFNNLLQVYNNTHQPQKTIDRLKELTHSKNGVVPDIVTYTVAFQSCAHLRENGAQTVKDIWNDIKYRLDKQNTTTTSSSLARKAAEVKWTESAIRTNVTPQSDLKLDDQMMIALLSAVTRTATCENDIMVGIEAIDRVYSLCPKRAATLMQKYHHFNQREPGYGIRPSTKALDAILRFSGGLHEYQLGKEYYELAQQQYPRLETDEMLKRTFEWVEKQMKRQRSLDRKKKRDNHRPTKDVKVSPSSSSS